MYIVLVILLNNGCSRSRIVSSTSCSRSRFILSVENSMDDTVFYLLTAISGTKLSMMLFDYFPSF